MSIKIEPLIINDTFPDHNVGNNIYYGTKGNERRIIKIGKEQNITNEYYALKYLESLFVPSRCKELFKFPYAFCVFKYGGKTAIEMSYEGPHTLEYFLNTRNRANIIFEVSKILNALLDYDLLWYAASPKNMILQRNNSYSLLDWEHGIKHTSSDDIENYRRAMELKEEWISFDELLLPYWSKKWPDINELIQSRCAVLSDFNIKLTKSRRIKELSTLCGIGNVITDAEYYRMLYVLSSLHNDSKTSRKRIIYVADYLSEWGYTDLRVKYSLIAWKLHDANPSALERVYEILMKMYCLRCLNMNSCISDCDGEIENLMLKLYGNSWLKHLVDNCREFILFGQSISQYKEYVVLASI